MKHKHDFKKTNKKTHIMSLYNDISHIIAYQHIILSMNTLRYIMKQTYVISYGIYGLRIWVCGQKKLSQMPYLTI